MSEAQPSQQAPSETGRDDRLSVLFAQLVMQQANMATMFLGKVAHPETGQVIKNIDAARLFIDQLEMLEAKTKGNLDKDESALLKQSLMNLRLAFVEAVQEPASEEARPESKDTATATQSAEGEKPPATTEDEHRKKFSKKY